MTEKQKHYRQILREFDMKRTANIRVSRQRKEEIYNKIPEIEQIENTLSSSGMKLVRMMLTAPEGTSTQEYKDEANNLTRQKHALLEQHNYSKDYLDPIYDCKHCEDTGFIENKTCTCFTQALINLAYKNSNINNSLDVESFDTFDLDLYSTDIDSTLNVSPRKQMHYIYKQILAYTETFGVEYKNLIFKGKPGLGKTFLCNCIAKELLDNGCTVLYLSANQLGKLLSNLTFNKEEVSQEAKGILETMLTVDLLIIDDLGAEFRAGTTGPDLFNIINERHLNKFSTIVSTNLEPSEWALYYSERVSSRFLGNYTLYQFLGTDIRIKKKYDC
ncbi:MAG: hypothetical protein BEN18_10465 [Epulopiscium sp. Nuni2H_MBin001]|nr:MAG: hypothetical protein BEN18_10465 [Epulopiscium sp. Nuni2H_MBin001]